MFCLNCGAELPDTAKFCNECGMKIEPKKQEMVTEKPSAKDISNEDAPVMEKPKMAFKEVDKEPEVQEEAPKKNQFVFTGKPKKAAPIIEEPEDDAEEDEDVEEEELAVNTAFLDEEDEDDEDEEEEAEDDEDSYDEDEEYENEDEEDDEPIIPPAPARKLSTARTPVPETRKLSTARNTTLSASESNYSSNYSIEDDAYWNDVLPEIDDEINQIPKDVILKAVGCVVALFVIIAWLIFML